MEISVERGIAAGLFLQGYRDIMDTASTLQSSPWTLENVGADEEKTNSMRYYMSQTIGSSIVTAIIASAIAGNLLPLFGTGLGIAYLWYIYEHARKKAIANNSNGEGWFKQ